MVYRWHPLVKSNGPMEHNVVNRSRTVLLSNWSRATDSLRRSHHDSLIVYSAGTCLATTQTFCLMWTTTTYLIGIYSYKIILIGPIIKPAIFWFTPWLIHYANSFQEIYLKASLRVYFTTFILWYTLPIESFKNYQWHKCIKARVEFPLIRFVVVKWNWSCRQVRTTPCRMR